jgi:hypothetical protein
LRALLAMATMLRAVRRVMYIENKSGGLDGEGRVGWVELSRSHRSYAYAGRRLLKTKSGYKYNCIDEETGETYWVSGPSRDGSDKLYGGIVAIDDDARAAYWSEVRATPERSAETSYRSAPSTRTSGGARVPRRQTR